MNPQHNIQPAIVSSKEARQTNKPQSADAFSYWFIEIVSALLIVLFVYTACTKLMEHQRFFLAMKKNPLIEEYAGFLSWWVPLSELCIATMLVLPRQRRAGLLASAITMAIFSVYVIYMVSTFTDLPCTCGGIIQQMTWQQHVVFNITFTTLAAIAYAMQRHRFIRINRSSRTPANIVGP